ncbi:MAG: peptidylprolyl isomerase [Polaribacter sp.]|nr:peptidylprolyl isomerase [Polaribacter sp.]MDG1811479.1 peptidylprolyl isomerase [Polaribacter sp.]MDG1994055.1 peptidylprolyl isomerase [Polaribacter sp.]
MKRSKLLVLLIFVFAILNCSEKKEKKSIPVPTKRKEKLIKKAEKTWDSLHKNNVESFFTAYEKTNKETKVRIQTAYGTITLRLYNDTPIHRANFIFLTKIKYFDKTVFYRIAKNFVIQGGNSDGYDAMKSRYKYGNYLIKPEFRPNRKHKYGALAAAREWEKNPDKLSSPFEFYIVQNRKGAHHLNNEHTVFGEVISGWETIDKIAELKTDVKEWPLVDVNMKVEILD